jgi:hypothetical protein
LALPLIDPEDDSDMFLQSTFTGIHGVISLKIEHVRTMLPSADVWSVKTSSSGGYMFLLEVDPLLRNYKALLPRGWNF